MLSIIAAAGILSQSANRFTEITVYNQGFGFIKEVRDFRLKEGRQTLAVEDVAALIESNSVGVRSLDDPNSFEVLEQNYEYDLINPLAILNKSVGKRVRFIRTIGQQKDVLEGTLISSPSAVVSTGSGSEQTYNGMVIRTDDGRIVLNPTGEVEVQQVPEGLISLPTLLWDINAAKAGNNTVELSYLTKGMSWNADYVLTLGADDQVGDLKGWVTLTNDCGTSFKNARLKLLAGDVQRAQPRGGAVLAPMMAKAARAVSDEAFKEEGLFEYHLYTLQRPTSVLNRQSKQISLLEARGIKVKKRLIVDSMMGYYGYYPNEGEVGTGNINPQVRVEFVNCKDNELGIPLPKGTIKVYKRDSSGSVQMLGEDQINHTPKEEKISLTVGRSFDVVTERKRTEFVRLSPNAVQETFQIEVRNRKDTPETVNVVERHSGDWRVTSKSIEFEKLDSNTMQFVVNLKPGEVRKVTYTVVTRW